MSVSIWGAVRLHSMDRWVLSGAGVQAPWHGVLETLFFATKLSRLDASANRKVVRWCRTQVSSHTSQGVLDGRANEGCVSTVASERSVFAVEAPRLRWLFATLLLQQSKPDPASRLKSATHGVYFLRSDSRCWPHVRDLSNVTPMYLGSEQITRTLLAHDIWHLARYSTPKVFEIF